MGRAALRPATERDAEFMYEVYASTRTEELTPLPWTEEQKEQFLRFQSLAQLTHYGEHYPGAEYLVITLDGQDVGRMLVQRTTSELRLMDIALLPQFRGQGIGSGLVSDLITEADSAGRAIVLHVESFNPAYGLYRRLGFVEDGEAGVYRRMVRPYRAVAS